MQLVPVRDYSPAQMALIRKTIAKDCNEDEFNLFIQICKHNGLDPFRKQIYPFVFKKKGKRVKTDKVDHRGKPIWEDGKEERQLTPVTAIDGYRAIAARSGDYRPDENEPEFEIDESLKDPEANPAGIIKCSVTVYKYGPDKQWHPVTGVARWEEFAPLVEDGKWQKGYNDEQGEWHDGEFVTNGKQVLDKKKPKWKQTPFHMLSKCAEAQALRKGWPETLSGLYVHEEVDRADAEQSATELAEQYEREERLKRIGGKNTIPAIMNATEGLQLIPVGEFADKVLAHLSTFESSKDIDFWKEQNRHALNQFWAEQKNDAFELKRQIEGLQATLENKELLPA